ncbi:MAG: hypothetical protein WAK13_10465, partial [Terriglobales bacterium]
TLKSSPEAFHDLLEIEGITPAPYVGRYKWVQIASSNLLPASELESLIRQSYELVASKAPKENAKSHTTKRKSPIAAKKKNRMPKTKSSSSHRGR